MPTPGTGHRGLAFTAYEYLLNCGPLASKLYAALYAGFQRCGRSDLAVKACRAAIACDPDDHEAYFAMAHGMAAIGYRASAVSAVLEKACNLDPHNETYRISLAMQLVCDGRADDAYRQLAAASIERLRRLDCLCSTRQLLQLCAQKGDRDRTIALRESVTRVNQNKARRQARCNEQQP